jgi:hypothetical protein
METAACCYHQNEQNNESYEMIQHLLFSSESVREEMIKSWRLRDEDW